MVREIVWTRIAQSQKISIYEYWNKRNKSNQFSQKLNILFNQNIEILSRFPFIGTTTQKSNVRVKPVQKYLIIYRIETKRIFILAIWDSRKNPDDFNRLIKLYQ